MRLAEQPTLASYRTVSGRYDELVADDGTVRDSWQRLVDVIGRIGAAEIDGRRALADRLLLAEGASHAVNDDADTSRPWLVDPVPLVITAKEWSGLEQGLVQRSRLLDAVLDDLYGAQRLLHDGILPAELVLSSPRYLRPCVGTVPAAGRRLVVHAVDVLRDGEGCLRAVGDHTDAPAGAGYALLNRTVLTRLFADVYRDLRVTRLDGFFAALRAGLAAQAPSDRDSPRTVVLTSGLGHPSYVEHSYLATHLGYHLVEGGDLTVRDGRLWLRALSGLEPVDVVLRRVDDANADPLELGRGGRGGVAALLQAARRGGVGLANALGSGLAGHQGLAAFLPALCEYLLGEPLRLASVPTSWCGDQAQLAEVLDDLEAMVLYDEHRPTALPVFASHLDDEGRRQWRERILTEPHRYVAQRKIAFATTPVLRGGTVVAGSVVVRAQMASTPQGYQVLPGGLGRVVIDDVPVIGQTSGVSKDVWVLAGETSTTRWTRSQPAVPQIDLRSSLPSRSAEALFWVGRNAERAETVARVGLALIARYEQAPELAELAGGRWLATTLAGLRAVSGAPVSAPTVTDVRAELAASTEGRPGSLIDALVHLGGSAASVREFLSVSTWRLLGTLEVTRLSLSADVAKADLFDVAEALEYVVQTMAAFAGLTAESVVRGPGWRFLDIGRRLERAMLLLNLAEATLTQTPDPAVRQPLYETVLAACESLVAYRRRYRSDLELDAVCELLLDDDTNPRSLAFQLDRLTDDLAALPERRARREQQALVASAQAQLLGVDWHRTSRPLAGSDQLVDFTQILLDTRQHLLRLADGLVAEWFAHADARTVRGAG
jgi:uncharacterized circularly permuted ATP-grasp superfamily protein/uncharacterized alpha-E superfamily protein